MDYKKFLKFNIFGGLFWTIGMLLAGFFLGKIIPDVDKYLLPIIALIVFLSLLPPIIEVYKENKAKIVNKLLKFSSKIW